MNADDDRTVGQDDDRTTGGAAFILPGAGLTTTQGIGSGAGTVTGSPVIPEPVVPPDSAGGGPNSLGDRIEEVLAEDGRFSALLRNLTFAADDNGHVTLGGTLPETAMKGSLLATINAIPGVTGVTDATG